VDLSRFYFLGLMVNFSFINGHFPIAMLVLDLFSGVYLNKLTVYMVPTD
jgi:hypothetical protein